MFIIIRHNFVSNGLPAKSWTLKHKDLKLLADGEIYPKPEKSPVFKYKLPTRIYLDGDIGPFLTPNRLLQSRML